MAGKKKKINHRGSFLVARHAKIWGEIKRLLTFSDQLFTGGAREIDSVRCTWPFPSNLLVLSVYCTKHTTRCADLYCRFCVSKKNSNLWSFSVSECISLGYIRAHFLVQLNWERCLFVLHSDKFTQKSCKKCNFLVVNYHNKAARHNESRKIEKLPNSIGLQAKFTWCFK